MSSFTAPLEITPAPRFRLWSVSRPFVFWSGEEGAGLAVAVEAGFLTDLGSIPRVARLIFEPADPRWAAAFVTHDKLCELAGFPRVVAAAVFLEAMAVLARENAAPRWRMWCMFAAVMAWALVHPYGPARATPRDPA